MKINKIELVNIKSYGTESDTIVFSDYLNVISGINEAGKTTILEAIGFLLFGTTNGKKQSELIKHGEETGTVKLWITAKDDREYEIFRSIGKSKKISIIDVETDEKLSIDEPSELYSWVRDNFSFSTSIDLRVLFEQIIGVPQGSMVSTFLDVPSSRKLKLDPILNVDNYKILYNNSRDLINVLEKHINENNLDLREFSTEMKDLPELEKKAKKIKSEQKIKSSELKRINETIPDLEKKVNTYFEIQEKIKNLAPKIENLSQRVNHKNESLSKLKIELEQSRSAKTIVEDNKEKYKQYQDFSKQKESLEKDMKTKNKLEKELSKIKQERASSDTNLKALKALLKELFQQEELYEAIKPKLAKQEVLEQQIKSIEDSLAQISLLEKQRAKDQEDLSKIKEESLILSKKIEKIKKIQFSPKNLENKINTKEKINNRIIELNANINKEKEFVNLTTDGLCPFFKKECPISEEPLNNYFLSNETKFTKELETEKISFKKTIDEIKALKVLEADYSKKEDLEKEFHLNEQKKEEYLNQISEWSAKISHKNSLNEKKITKLGEIKEIGSPKDKAIVITEKLNQKLKIEKNLAREEKENANINQLVSSLVKNLTQFNDLEEHISQITKTLSNTQQNYKLYIKNIDISKKVSDLVESVNHLEIEIKKIKNELISKNDEISKLNSIYDSKLHSNSEKELKNLNNRKISLNTELRTIKKDIFECEKKISDLKKLEEKIKTLKVEMQNDLDLKELIEFIRNVYNNVGPELVDYYIKKISIDATNFFRILTGDYGRILEITNDYEIILKSNSEEIPFKLFSGGQQISAVLAVRLGFIQNLSEVKFAFFDEPTQNLDEQRRIRLAEALNKIPNMQLVVISHDDTFEQCFDHVIKIENDPVKGSKVVN